MSHGNVISQINLFFKVCDKIKFRKYKLKSTFLSEKESKPIRKWREADAYWEQSNIIDAALSGNN